jgi:hypothetical protein
MASGTWTITSLFTPVSKPSVERKDSGLTDVISQLNQFKGFGDEASSENQEYVEVL